MYVNMCACIHDCTEFSSAILKPASSDVAVSWGRRTQATGGDVCREHDRARPAAELPQHPLPLHLALAAVHPERRPAAEAQHARQVVAAAVRRAEREHAAAVKVAVEERREGGVAAAVVGDGLEVLRDGGVGAVARAADGDGRWVL